MVTTKVNGLEIAVGPDSGVVYMRTGVNKMPKDVITWQDLEDFRIWIHSRQSDQGFKPVSMDIQALGNQNIQRVWLLLKLKHVLPLQQLPLRIFRALASVMV